MDSLLANYASSDEEAEASHQQHHHQSEGRLGTQISNFSQSSIPIPQSSSSSFSTLFSALPPPKSHPDPSPVANSFNTIPIPKRVVQFRPPVIPSPASSLKLNDDDEDDDLDRKKHQVAKQNTSAKCLISSMPAPKHSSTLGAGTFPGSGRRAVVETVGLSSNLGGFKAENEVGVLCNGSGGEGKLDNGASNSNSSGISEIQSAEGVPEVNEATTWGETDQSYPGYDNYGGYVGYQYENHYGRYDQTNWASDSAAAYIPDTSAATAYIPNTSATVEAVAKVSEKRRRDQIPADIVEVSQDELMKNRPRQDQVKLTGIAFGPAYQAAPSAGKPTKLHKRKHQIGSLYFEMKQKELELAERRSKGMLTKAQTQGKYGW